MLRRFDLKSPKNLSGLNFRDFKEARKSILFKQPKRFLEMIKKLKIIKH